jgi:hypothetical protein
MKWQQFVNESPVALMWTFHNAPAELRALSTHGGDEDYVAVWAKRHESELDTPIGWRLENFSPASNDRHEYGEFIVWIGATFRREEAPE